MKKQLWFIFLFFVAATVQLSAQTLEKGEQQDQLVFEKEWTVGFFLTTPGWGLNGSLYKVKNIKTKRVLSMSFQELRDPTERKTPGFTYPDGSQRKGFFYAKLNKFYTLDFMVGQQRGFAKKGRKDGIEIAWKYLIGGSLGVAKPYYIQVSSDGELQTIKYDGENDFVFLNNEAIVSGVEFSYGLNELSLYPGGIAKVGLVFDWASAQKVVWALDTGIQLQAFYKPVPLMLTTNDRLLFPRFYLNLKFGMRQ